MRPSIYSERYQRFRVLLREIRKEKELTQVELAEALGQLQSYVSKYESGERRLDVVEFMDLCDALKVDPRDVIGRLMAPPDPATVPSPLAEKVRRRRMGIMQRFMPTKADVAID